MMTDYTTITIEFKTADIIVGELLGVDMRFFGANREHLEKLVPGVLTVLEGETPDYPHSDLYMLVFNDDVKAVEFKLRFGDYIAEADDERARRIRERIEARSKSPGTIVNRSTFSISKAISGVTFIKEDKPGVAPSIATFTPLPQHAPGLPAPITSKGIPDNIKVKLPKW